MLANGCGILVFGMRYVGTYYYKTCKEIKWQRCFCDP